MWFWGKAQEPERGAIGVARAAVEGVEGQDLLREAIKTLLASGQADRVGVWVDMEDYGSADSGPQTSFRGIVAEKDGEETPAEWSRLSPQPPLPAELLGSLRTVEQDVDAPDKPMIGALIEMRRAIWVPLQVHAQLRGGRCPSRPPRGARSHGPGRIRAGHLRHENARTRWRTLLPGPGARQKSAARAFLVRHRRRARRAYPRFSGAQSPAPCSKTFSRRGAHGEDSRRSRGHLAARAFTCTGGEEKCSEVINDPYQGTHHFVGQR